MSLSEDHKPTVSEESYTPPSPSRLPLTQRVAHRVRSLGHRDAWLGDYHWGALFKPRWLPYSRKNHEQDTLGFYGLDDELPILLAAVAGLQHSLAMLAGLITPPTILGASLNLPADQRSYLVSASLITAGLLSCMQMSRIPLPRGYQIGTGLLSVVGTSFATLSTASAIISHLYGDGTCPTVNGVKQACPEAYGYILGTAALCSLLEIGLSFVPVRYIKRALPPVITGPVVFLIGVSLIQSSAFANWGGGAGCGPTPAEQCFDPHGYVWGSGRYIGLGFLSFMTVILIEIFGSPAMRNASIVLGLFLPLIVAGPTGYISRAQIDASPAITFLWVHTFPLKVYGPAILPLMAVYLSLAAEAVGDITASADVSLQPVTGKSFDRRIQGGILSDGLGGLLSALFTITPMSVFAQNNGVIAITRIANRRAGYWCCAWLILFGVLGKISGALLSIPAPVLGGVTTILFASVAASGLKIISTVKFTRRIRFLLTLSLGIGMGNLLIPTWFSSVFTYPQNGPNSALRGFMDSIEIIVETPFLICAIVGLIANVILPMEREDIQAQEEEARSREQAILEGGQQQHDRSSVQGEDDVVSPQQHEIGSEEKQR